MPIAIPRVERAVLLGALDRRQEAQQAFVDILRRSPQNFSALNEFGTLLTQMGAIDAACRVYAEAILHHPENPMARVNLANLLLRANRHAEAREHYEAVLRIDPDHAEAHQGLGAVLSDIGDRDGGAASFPARLSRPRGLDAALSRHQAAGDAAATGLVGRRQHSDRGGARRLHLSDLGDRHRLSRSEDRLAAASADLQRHRRCRPLPARA